MRNILIYIPVVMSLGFQVFAKDNLVQEAKFTWEASIADRKYKGNDFKTLLRDGIVLNIGTPVSCKFQLKRDKVNVGRGSFISEDLAMTCNHGDLEFSSSPLTCMKSSDGSNGAGNIRSFTFRNGSKKTLLSFICTVE